MDAETVGTNTLRVMQALGARQDNGSLYFDDLTKFDDYGNWLSAARIPADFIPCSISMIDSVTRKDKMPSLVMMINPKDFTVSQSFVSNSANTRKGWINTLWGNQQATLSAAGMTAGFYYVYANGFGGISNFSRKNSVSFFNLLAIMTLFKNNGYYYMDGQENPTLFSNVGSSLSKSADFRNMYDYVGNSLGAGSDLITTGTYNRANESSSTSLGGSRVINVMDIIKISYDGSDYIGNFTTFSLSDVADNPYRMEYNFEFSVSIFGSDPNSIDGHIEMNNNSGSDKIVVAIQGRNTHFDETVGMDETELKSYFPDKPIPDKYVDKNYIVSLTGNVQKDTISQLKVDEDVRQDVYRDTKGNLTVGVGHLVTLADNLRFGDTIPIDKVNEYLNQDYATVERAAANVVPDIASMPENVQCALVNMAYNMGGGGLAEFHNTIAKLRSGDYEGAANNLVQSKWYTETGVRAMRIVYSIRNTGKSSSIAGVSVAENSPATQTNGSGYNK